MILHWLSTAWRSLISNPLFSLITIASLSVGCCGAVLAGSNILQHLTFERGYAGADRIMIVTRQIPPIKGTTWSVATAAPVVAPGAKDTSGKPSPSVVMPLKDAIAGKIPGIEAQTRLFYSPTLTQADADAVGQSPEDPDDVPMTTVYVDADFFKVFALEFVEGSAEGLQQPDAVVITQARSAALFPGKPAVGQTIAGVKNHTLRVIGVVRDQPANTHLTFEVIAGLTTRQLIGGMPAGFETMWNLRDGFHYIKLTPGADAGLVTASVATAFKTAIEQNTPQTMPPPQIINGVAQPVQVPLRAYSDWSLVPLLASHLAGPGKIVFPPATAPAVDLRMLWMLGLAAIALMVISGFNYVTLSLARNLRRRREVAVRKVMGAGKAAIVRHYMAESAFMTAIAMGIGFALAELLHPWFARGIGQPEVLFGLYKPEFLAATAIAYVALVLTVGAYPALYLGSVRPQSGLGEDPAPMPGALGRFVSSGLLGLQLAAAAGLVIVSVTMVAQASFLSNRFMGFEVKDRYVASTRCPFSSAPNSDMRALDALCYRTTAELLKTTPGITSVAGFNGGMLSSGRTELPIGRAPAGETLGSVLKMTVDTDFLQNVGARLLAGRYLDSNSAYDRALITRQLIRDTLPDPEPPGVLPPRPTRLPVIVSRSVVPLLGASTPDEAIGQEFVTMQAGDPRAPANPRYEVVGVIEDWHQRPLNYQVSPIIFIPDKTYSYIVEIPKAEFDGVSAVLNAGWRQALGNPQLKFELTGLQDTLDRAYQADFQLMWALIGFAGVAVIVAGMGVYGLSAFEMRRRVREIGIRKALGASPGKVAGLVIGRALVFAAIATLTAWPVGWWLSQQWLHAFVYRTQMGPAVLLAASLAVVAFVALAVTLNAVRAAAVRPNIALRTTG